MMASGSTCRRGPSPLAAMVYVILALLVGAQALRVNVGANVLDGLPATVSAWEQPTRAAGRRLSQYASAEECLTQGIGKVANSCPDYNSTRSKSNADNDMRDAMIRLLQTCLLGEQAATSNQSMRILMPNGTISQMFTILGSAYAQTTGIPIKQEAYLTNYTQVRLASIQNAAIQNMTHEAWLISVSGIGDGLASNAFMDLSELVLYDQKVDWQGLLTQVRSVGLIYGGKVVSLPLGSYSYQLMYRLDTFETNGWPVPRTWKELVEFSVTRNGTDDMWAFCGGWGPCGALGTNLFKYILASYHQTHGASQGWLIDPDTMRLMLDTPAVIEAIRILRVLYKMSPPDNSLAANCNTQATPFFTNKCLITLSWGTTFKAISYKANNDSMYGNLGVAPVPGSERVLDRTTNTLELCNPDRCPLAAWHVYQNGSGAWINTSPGFEASLMALNAQSSSTLQFYSYSVGSYFARESSNDQLVFHPTAEVLPIRITQLNPYRWAAQGFDLKDAERYCTAHQASLTDRNMHVQIRIPGASTFVTLFNNLITMMFTTNQTSLAVAQQAQIRGWAILNSTFRGNSTRLMEEYWSSINKPFPPQPSPPPPSVPINTPSPADSSSQSEFISSTQIIVIVLCIILPASLIVAVVLLRMHILGGRGNTWRKPPGAGPDTTLLVTDIEGSTTLWEELDATVMDSGVKMHDACMRKTMLKHKGYESVWEGDSFVIAFTTPLAALNFSLEVHKALQALPWPPALLTNPRSAEVWLMANKSGTRGDTAAIQAALQFQAGSSTISRPTWGTGLRNPMALGPTTTNTSFAQSSCNGGANSNSTVHRLAGGAPEVLGERTSNGSVHQPKISNSGAAEKPKQQGYTSVFRNLSTFALHVPQSNSSGGTFSSPDTFIKPPASSHKLKTEEDLHSLPFPLPEEDNGSDAGDDPITKEPSAGLLGTAGLEGGVNSSFAAPTFLTRALDSRRWSLRHKWASKWVISHHSQNSATLVFRGLRVRIGFHSGVDKAPEYNKSSRKYLYSGQIRIVSNVVAFAGHGGFIMVSSQTATRLGMDLNGQLRSLPSDCHVYHMGNHMLSDVPDGPVELLLLLPATMKCLLAYQQSPLRSLSCVVPGVLDAPAPPPSWAAGLLPEPVLVAVQISGLAALLAWDKDETFHALQQTLEVANSELREWSGVMSEDGITLVLQTGIVEQGRLTGALRDTITPGRLVAAFHDPACALRWALSLRHRLLTLEWSSDLLTQDTCEQVGLLPADEQDGVTLCVYRELSVGAASGPKNEPKAKAEPPPLTSGSLRMRHVAIPQSQPGVRSANHSMTASEAEFPNRQGSGAKSQLGDRKMVDLVELQNNPEYVATSSFDLGPHVQMPLIPEQTVSHTTFKPFRASSSSSSGGPGKGHMPMVELRMDSNPHAGGDGHVVLLLDEEDDKPDDDNDDERSSKHSSIILSSARTTPAVGQSRAQTSPQLVEGPNSEANLGGGRRTATRPSMMAPPSMLNFSQRWQSDSAALGNLTAHQEVTMSPAAPNMGRMRGSNTGRSGKGPLSVTQHLLTSYTGEGGLLSSGTFANNAWMSTNDARLQSQVSRHIAAGTTEPGGATVYAFDAAMLRGLRLRMATVAGPTSIHVAVTSTGRAVYRGHAVKQLQKLLQQARTGQLLVSGTVMQNAQI